MQNKTIIAGLMFVFLLLTGVCYAGTNLIELNVSQSTIQAGYEHKMPVEYGFLTGGIGAQYSEDDYKIGELKFALGNVMSSAGLAFNLGFKGVLGNVEKGSEEADVMALCFLFEGTVTVPETLLPIPVDLSLDAAMAPDPLCFLDSDRYLDLKASLDFRIIRNAAVLIGYRYVETRVEQGSDNWEMSDGTIFIGYQLKF
ncbi:MAG: YfaZ family outer membrane protein [Thermodesulfobacteriota bacterium]